MVDFLVKGRRPDDGPGPGQGITCKAALRTWTDRLGDIPLVLIVVGTIGGLAHIPQVAVVGGVGSRAILPTGPGDGRSIAGATGVFTTRVSARIC